MLHMIGHVSDYAFHRSCVPLLVRVHGFLYVHGFAKKIYAVVSPHFGMRVRRVSLDKGSGNGQKEKSLWRWRDD